MVRYLILALLLTGCSRFARVSSMHSWQETYYVQAVAGGRVEVSESLNVETYTGVYEDGETSPMVGVGFNLRWDDMLLLWYLDYVVRGDGTLEPTGWVEFEVKL